MMGRLYSGSGPSGMMGSTSSRSWMMSQTGYRWMMGGLDAPAWMRGSALPGYMMGTSNDPGKIMGALFANAPGTRVSPAQTASLGSQIPACTPQRSASPPAQQGPTGTCARSPSTHRKE
jgi:hypothetical protein